MKLGSGFKGTALFLGGIFSVVIATAVVFPEKFRAFTDLWANADPRLVSPEVVELGAVELGQMAEARFQLANQGKSNLVLTDFRSGCACDGLEYWNGNEFARFSMLTIEPGGLANVRLIQRARGLIGQEFKTIITFQSNDPKKRDVVIGIRVATITGGSFFSVQSIETGTIRLGDKYETQVDIFDQSGLGRKVERTASTAPETVKVRLIPPSEILNPPELNTDREFLGRLQVTVDALNPGPIHGAVLTYLSCRPNEPSRITVQGRASPLIEFAPAQICLPRNSEMGLLFNTNCICRSSFGIPFTLRVQNCPKELDVQVGGQEMASTHSVNISMPERFRLGFPGEKADFRIQMVAKMEVKEMNILVPVTVQKNPQE